VYFEFGTVKIEGHPEATAEYIWGDRTLRTIHCKSCGCVTHWEPLESKPGAKHGVNLGNFAPKLIASVRVRRFDGADTWQFIDEESDHWAAMSAVPPEVEQLVRAAIELHLEGLREDGAPISSPSSRIDCVEVAA
jgi:hypothetical protein